MWFPKRRSCQSQLAIPEVFLGIRVPLQGCQTFEKLPNWLVHVGAIWATMSQLWTLLHVERRDMVTRKCAYGVSKALRWVREGKLAREQNLLESLCVSWHCGRLSHAYKWQRKQFLTKWKTFCTAHCYCESGVFYYPLLGALNKLGGYNPICQEFHQGKIEQWAMITKISVAWFMLALPWRLLSTRFFAQTKSKIRGSTWYSYMLIHANLRVPPNATATHTPKK